MLRPPAEWFVQRIKMSTAELDILYRNLEPMMLMDDDGENFGMAPPCHVCRGIPKENEREVGDHCHMTDKYRGAAHNGRIVNYKNSKFVPVVFHKSSGYDERFLIEEFAYDEILKDVRLFWRRTKIDTSPSPSLLRAASSILDV